MSSSKPFRDLTRRINLTRSTAPILKSSKVQYGNQISEDFENKSRRIWRANLRKVDWPVTILGGRDQLNAPRTPFLKNVKMRARSVKDVERKGGIEATLVSTPPDKLAPYGRKLRSAVFEELHRIKDELYLAELSAEEMKQRQREMSRGDLIAKSKTGSIGVSRRKAVEEERKEEVPLIA